MILKITIPVRAYTEDTVLIWNEDCSVDILGTPLNFIQLKLISFVITAVIVKSKSDCVLIIIVTSSGLASDAAPRNAPEAEVEATGDIGATRISAAIFSPRKCGNNVERTSKLKIITTL